MAKQKEQIMQLMENYQTLNKEKNEEIDGLNEDIQLLKESELSGEKAEKLFSRDEYV